MKWPCRKWRRGIGTNNARHDYQQKFIPLKSILEHTGSSTVLQTEYKQTRQKHRKTKNVYKGWSSSHDAACEWNEWVSHDNVTKRYEIFCQITKSVACWYYFLSILKYYVPRYISPHLITALYQHIRFFECRARATLLACTHRWARLAALITL